MLNFLKESRKFLAHQENLLIILGNESCDLDSAASALSLAYYYSQKTHEIPTNSIIKGIFPVLNVTRKNFPIKTEVKHILAEFQITENHLIFKDDLNETQFSKNEIILVDHHVSPYHSNVVGVFDHRPYNADCNLSERCHKTIEKVGSCSTLISMEFLKTDKPKDYELPLSLLYHAIILDTVNFSDKVNIFTEKDVEVVNKIESLFPEKFSEIKRKDIFEKINKVKADISSLTPYQVLNKDAKFLSFNGVNISLPGFPMAVQEFVSLPEAHENLDEFVEEFDSTAIVLIGQKHVENGVLRDIGIISGDSGLKDELSEALKKARNDKGQQLQLEEIKGCTFMNGIYFKQHNLELTRKFILPIVETVLKNFSK
ncbi:PRUNE family protein [Megaselia abdita]